MALNKFITERKWLANLKHQIPTGKIPNTHAVFPTKHITDQKKFFFSVFRGLGFFHYMSWNELCGLEPIPLCIFQSQISRSPSRIHQRRGKVNKALCQQKTFQKSVFSTAEKKFNSKFLLLAIKVGNTDFQYHFLQILCQRPPDQCCSNHGSHRGGHHHHHHRRVSALFDQLHPMFVLAPTSVPNDASKSLTLPTMASKVRDELSE